MIAAPPPLETDAIHLWRMPIDDARLLETLFALLSDEEAARCLRFRDDADRARAVAARGLLRHLLAGYLDRAPRSLVFTIEPHGKPALRDAELAFNAAHSGRWVVVAVARSGKIGVDVEQRRDDGDVVTDCARFFTPAEQARIRNAAGPVAEFFRLWTRKEACLKAIGTGLSLPLDAFDSSPEHVRIPSGETLTVIEAATDVQHAGAVATTMPSARVLHFTPAGTSSNGRRLRRPLR